MTTAQRREPIDREPSLRAIATAQPMTGRGFAASRGVRLDKAERTGATIVGLHRNPRPVAEQCTAESFCDEARSEDYLWCERHVTRAQAIGAVAPR